MLHRNCNRFYLEIFIPAEKQAKPSKLTLMCLIAFYGTSKTFIQKQANENLERPEDYRNRGYRD